MRFPALLERLLPILPPVELAARVAARRAMQKTGLKREEIGIFFISPCPAKVTYVQDPLCIEKSEIDRVLAVKKVYTALLPLMNADDAEKDLKIAGGQLYRRQNGQQPL